MAGLQQIAETAQQAGPTLAQGTNAAPRSSGPAPTIAQGAGLDPALTQPPSQANLEAADRNLKLTPEERALYLRHLSNLYSSGGFNQPNGSRSSLLASTFDIGGRTYVMPTVANGRQLQPGTPEYRSFIESQGGPPAFPSYATREEADARYNALHDYMERDTQAYQQQTRRRRR